jgi:hypothetical protein
MRRTASAALLRRVDAVEAEVAKRWLARVVAVVGDELQRQPEAVARAVMQQIAGLQPKSDDDIASLILDAVRDVALDLAEAVDRRLCRATQGETK